MTGIRRSKNVLAAACGGLLMTLAPAGMAHDPTARGPGVLGHSGGGDLEVKRVKQTGKGMPSVEGPFPDTVNMDFLGQLTNAQLGVDRLIQSGASFLSDIWGWTSPGGDEYALIGTTSGVAFARITDPANPEFLGMIPTTDTGTQRNWWWDIKTFGNFAYYVTEVNGAGVAIYDLTRLDGLSAVTPGTPAAILEDDGRWGVDPADGYLRAHNISINEDTGFAYLTGASKDPAVDPDFTDDGVIVLDLSDPMNPIEVATINGVDSHDAQVVTYDGPDGDYADREIALLFNGGDLEVGVFDVTDKTDIREIASFDYPGASFAHQGWFTEDQAFILVGDEEDELFGLQDPRNADLPDTARTYICDARDLDQVDCYGAFDSPAASIDHNLFVKGDKVYQAHYTAGIRVLQISDDGTGSGRIALSEAGHMDTEPRLPNNNLNYNFNIFAGPWGVFPYFDSGSVIASDGFNGLVVMKLAD